ncbi:MAG: AAA family ATPase [Bacteroidetes bacterium]|nr:AAA family ATPase [Bacteroidota bacterium]
MNPNERPDYSGRTPIQKPSKNIQLPDHLRAPNKPVQQQLPIIPPDPQPEPQPDPVTEEAMRIYYARQREDEEKQKRGGNLFKGQSVRKWMLDAKRIAAPNLLFDEFWWEHECCILFADTNLGKSALAVQIADSISRGVPIPGFKMTAMAQKVLYFDFELSAKQFQMRYTENYENEYAFSENFIRAEINPDDDHTQWGYTNFETYMYDQIAAYIEAEQIRVVIIDNLTALRSDNERARDAYPLMKMLNSLKKLNKGTSVLVISHTPKRDSTQPLDENSLQGSKQFSNLCDSMFAIGKNHRDPRTVYIKQCKGRNGQKKYMEDNVCLCQLVKHTNFLGFEFMDYARECDLLKPMGDKEYGQKQAAAKDLHAQGLSQREIAKTLGLSLGAVNKYLNK